MAGSGVWSVWCLALCVACVSADLVRGLVLRAGPILLAGMWRCGGGPAGHALVRSRFDVSSRSGD